MARDKYYISAILVGSSTICDGVPVSEGEKSYHFQLVLTVQILIVTHHQKRKRVIELHMHVSLFSLLYTRQDTITSLAINNTIFSLLVNSAV